MSGVRSYCRLCQASCGVLLDIVDGKVRSVNGDRDNPLSRGYTCAKGRRVGELLSHPRRLTSSMRATGDPARPFLPTSATRAISDIAGRLTRIIQQHGPDAVALYMGTQHNFATLTPPMSRSWFKAIGSRSLFSTMTIDQSAKWVTIRRMGEYLGGRQDFSTADVWMLAGTNPIVSVNGGNADGALLHNPSATLRDARRRGLRLIVIDPRRTETAYRADVHLRPRPGTDAALFAGLLNIILTENLHDADFCDRHVDGLDRLRESVSFASADTVESITSVPANDLIAAARLFATGPRGMVSTGTGICMGPHSNVTEHLATTLNVVCGRYRREGEPYSRGPLGRYRAARAAVAPPRHEWETGYQSPTGDGLLFGQLPSNKLAEAITSDRQPIRALIVSGGNPLLALPDPTRTRAALESLELLVTLDTRVSETADMADFVIAPTMMYERADNTVSVERFFSAPYANSTSPVVAAATGVIDDWQFYYLLARSMGLQLEFAGSALDMTTEPTADSLLRSLTSTTRVSAAELESHPEGLIRDVVEYVAPPQAGDAGNRLRVLPPEVDAELRAAIDDFSVRAADTGSFPLRLTVRRGRQYMNSVGRDVPELAPGGYNAVSAHPSHLAEHDVEEGSEMTLRSRHGAIRVVVRADSTLPVGVVTIHHGWSTSVDAALAANVNELLSAHAGRQSINAMPVMTAVPVRLERLDPGHP